MVRKRIENPVRKCTVSISQDSWEFINKYKHGSEARYLAVNRLIGEYKLKDISKVVEERDQARRTIQALYDRIHALEEELKKVKNLDMWVYN